MKKTIIPIRGMHCKACEILIGEKLEELKNVKKVQVSVKEKKAEIISDGPLSMDRVREKVEAAGYDALTASYGNDKATYGNAWVDGVRGVVRPILTLLFFILSCIVFGIVAQYVWVRGVPLTNDQLYELFKYCIYWVLFQASVCVGWWFAMRPGNKSPFK